MMDENQEHSMPDDHAGGLLVEQSVDRRTDSASFDKLPMRRPLLPLGLFFAVGIYFGGTQSIPDWLGWVFTGVGSLSAALLALARLGGIYRFLLWALALMGLGLLRGGLPENDQTSPTDQRVVVRGIARSGWERFKNIRRLEIDIDSVRPPGGTKKIVEARVRVAVWHNPESHSECPMVLPGDRILALVRMKVPRSSHNPGVTDHVERLARKKIRWIGYVRSCDEIMVSEKNVAMSLSRPSEKLRAQILDRIQKHPGSDAAKGIVAALSVGERGLAPQFVKDDFQAAGLMHLLAISGLHLGFVVIGLYFLLVRLLVILPGCAQRMDVRRIAACFVIPAAVFYTLLAGAALPVIRACVMAVCFLISVVLRRDADSIHTLAASAMIILAIWPQSLFEASFLMSFSAVFFIILGVPRFARMLGLPLSNNYTDKPWYMRLGVRLLHMLLVSVAATMGTAPLTARFFNQLSFLGPLINLAAVPLACLIMVPLGLLTAVVMPISGGLASELIGLNIWFADWLAALASAAGDCPLSSHAVATPGKIEVCAWIAVLLAAILSLSKESMPSAKEWSLRRKARVLMLVAGLVLAVAFGSRQFNHLSWDRMQITFIDVRQGDAVLVRFPSGKTLLIDAGRGGNEGYDAGRWVVAPFLWGQGISKLDYVAVTHREMDHAGGMLSIIRWFQPKEIWVNAPLEEVPLTEDLLVAVKKQDVRIRILKAGDKPYREEDCEVSVLWPGDNASELKENERSLVLTIAYKRHVVLLTGDLEKEGEARLLDGRQNLKADVLKIGHHGSNGATSEAFLKRVKPKIGVISVGLDNQHGLPHARLMERLEGQGVRVFRTDLHGAITLDLFDNEQKVETFLPGGFE